MGDVSGVVGMAGGVGVGNGKTGSNLSEGVGIRVSAPLADVVGSVNGGVGRVGSHGAHSTISGSVSRVDVAGRVGDVGDVSGVVGTSAGNGVGQRQTGSNLADGVGISFSFGWHGSDGKGGNNKGSHVDCETPK